MSGISVSPDFPFRRIKIAKRWLTPMPPKLSSMWFPTSASIPYVRVTRRRVAAIHQVCTVMTGSDVARHLNMG